MKIPIIQVLQLVVNLLHTSGLFLCPLNTSENFYRFLVLSGEYRKRPVASKSKFVTKYVSCLQNARVLNIRFVSICFFLLVFETFPGYMKFKIGTFNDFISINDFISQKIEAFLKWYE